MSLLRHTYGKDRVRVLRIHRDGERHEVREMSVQAMLTGDFSATFIAADNSPSLCTDTVKNIVNIVAREGLALDKEAFCTAVAQRLLGAYPQVDSVSVTGFETVWDRLLVDGSEHPHSFTLNGNGKPFTRVTMTRDTTTRVSGISAFTFLKSTQSGWSNFHKDSYTTLAETDDRIAATSMEASWLWRATPHDYAATNATILATMLKVFATTYSHSIQDSLYRMATTALEAVPEIEEISLACPNKHYIPVSLSVFGQSNENQVFVATDEPHGQIECTVGR